MYSELKFLIDGQTILFYVKYLKDHVACDIFEWLLRLPFLTRLQRSQNEVYDFSIEALEYLMKH